MCTSRVGCATLSEQCGANATQLSRVEAELCAERKKRRGLESITQEAMHTLRKAMKVLNEGEVFGGKKNLLLYCYCIIDHYYRLSSSLVARI